MRLHHIVLSTVLALLTCACSQTPPPAEQPQAATQPKPPAVATSETTSEPKTELGGLEDIIPGDEVQKIFDREKRKGREDDQDAIKHQEFENRLLKQIARAEKANDVQRQVKLLIRLGGYQREHRHAKQSLKQFNDAYMCAESLDRSDPLFVAAPLALGETYLRMGKIDNALKYLEEGLDRVGPGVNAAGESRERIQLRIAWAYRMADRLDDAQKLVASAKAKILERDGKRSPVYRVALIEESALAQTKDDEATASKINKAIAALPPMQPEGSDFGRHFLRLASHVLHRKGVTLDEQDYLDEQADVFGDVYHAWLNKHHGEAEE